MKAVSLEAQGKVEPAIEAYVSGLQIFPTDEVMRSGMEKLVLEKIAPEDLRRKNWAEYHVKKAENNAELFYTDAALYEYRRALRISPFDTEVRKKYAELLLKNNLYESYLAQMKFIFQTDKSREVKEAVESYTSLLRTSLENRWGKNTLTLNKNRVKLGLYCFSQNPQLLHPELEYIVSLALKDHFTSIPYFAIKDNPEYVSGYTQAFRYARNSGDDYFALISAEESERELVVELKLYSGRTGNEAKSFKVYRTGNDRFANVLLKVAEKIKEDFPIRGKILDRKDSVVLLDSGYYDGLKSEQILTVVKGGRLYTQDSGVGLMCNPQDIYGTVKVTKVEENLSQGVFSRKGFYDRINAGDEVFVVISEKETDAAEKKSPLEDDFDFSLTKPLLLDLVQNISN
jgi:tetratricopeptide (TPR) repeat protein